MRLEQLILRYVRYTNWKKTAICRSCKFYRSLSIRITMFPLPLLNFSISFLFSRSASIRLTFPSEYFSLLRRFFWVILPPWPRIMSITPWRSAGSGSFFSGIGVLIFGFSADSSREIFFFCP